MTQRIPIFNDYNEAGYRVNIVRCRSSRTEDEAIVRNLRHRWPVELEPHNDQTLVNAYDEFAMSDEYGDNDARFLDWLADYTRD